MDGGYVLDFSNRTFEDFFREVVGVRYTMLAMAGSGQGESGMRAFWQFRQMISCDRFFKASLKLDILLARTDQRLRTSLSAEDDKKLGG